MKLIIDENQLKELSNINNNNNIIYSGIFFNKNELLKKYDLVHENIYYHHSTIEFKPKNVSNLPIGEIMTLKIIGRLTTDKVDALLIENPLSKNEYPHITLSTANNVKPYESNNEIRLNLDKIEKLNDQINGIVGYCDNKMNIITSDNKLTESPDRVLVDNNVLVKYDGGIADDIVFGFYDNKALLGLNTYFLYKNNNLLSTRYIDIIEDEIEISPRNFTTHDTIMNFNKLIENVPINFPLNLEREDFEYPGRFWVESKIISFWMYPPKEKLYDILSKLNQELKHLYNFTTNFYDYKIEIINSSENVNSTNINNKLNWSKTSLIPVKNYINSDDNSLEDIRKMHVMPSDEKKKQPQMQIALKDKYKQIGNKLGNMTQAEYNWYKNYGIGDSKKPNCNKDIINEVETDDVDLSSFKIQKKLHEKFWINDKLNKKVRIRLIDIADEFVNSIKINSDLVKDYLFLGSLANYNWSKYSDIDLHILIDFKKINKDTDLVKDYFDSKKKIWNDEHENLKIYGFQVELYIQDINEENSSGGVYSLEKNKWLIKPKQNMGEIFNPKKVKDKASLIMTEIDDLEENFKKNKNIEIISNKAKKIYDKIKKIRKEGLNTKKSEMSNGNIIFKVLRRSGYLEKIIDLKKDTYDKLNSIK